MLLQTVRRAAALWGGVRVELGGRALLIDCQPLASTARCRTCDAFLGRFACRLGPSATCLACALAPPPAGGAPVAATLRPWPAAPTRPHGGAHSRHVAAPRR